MPICAICGEDSYIVTKCKQCGAKFCEYCGELDDQLCEYSIDSDSYEDENLGYEDEDWVEETPLRTRFQH